MIVASVLLGYAFCLLSCIPYLYVLQVNRYKPFCGNHCAKLWAWSGGGLAVSLLAGILWSRLLPQAEWRGLSVVVGYVPVVVVILCQRVWRLPLKRTARVMRLWVTGGVFLAIPAVLTIVWPQLCPCWGIWGNLSYVVLNLAACCWYPVEQSRNRRFVARCADELQCKNITVIAVTGSAGKTGVKRLLACAMGEDCYATQGNYNTPMGLALSIRSIPDNARYFVAEMGISHPADMDKLLAVIPHPDVGILTSVWPQHTQYLTMEQIRQEKTKLLQQSRWKLCNTQAGVQMPDLHFYGAGGQWWADDVQLYKDGTSFVLCDAHSRTPVHIPLCGRQTVENALAAWAAARYLGVDGEVIAKRWGGIKPDPHRLCPVDNGHGVTVIDDSYNCNIAGARYAMEYLQLYEGRKLVAVSGIAESDPDLEQNQLLGRIVSQADIVIIVGKQYREWLRQGLRRDCTVYTVDSTKESAALYAKLLRKGDTLLILADMPIMP